MKKIEQYFLFDISKNLYCCGDGDFVKINELREGGYSKRSVSSRIKEVDYPFHDGEWFFVKINEDGSKKLFQKDDEI